MRSKAYNALSVSEKKAIEATDTWTAFTEITQNLGSMYHYDESTGIDVRATSAENLPWYIKLVATPKTASEKQKTKVQERTGRQQRTVHPVRYPLHQHAG